MFNNDQEKEVGWLLAAWKLIQGMVNHSVLCLDDGDDQKTIRPQTSASSTLFNILLVDLISPLVAQPPDRVSMLTRLEEICARPHFNGASSIEPLRSALEELTAWLDFEVTFEEVWLPSIDREMTLVMARKEFLYHCGNMAKHNTFHLTVVAKKIYVVLNRSDPTTSLNDAYLAMEDFEERFHDDVFRYHLSKLSEMLNNVTWGIYEYLLPEYHRSYTVDHEKSQERHYTSYRFSYPSGVASELGKAYYWDLMNKIRAKPYVPRFKASPYLVGQY